jgi:hypothetical protein
VSWRRSTGHGEAALRFLEKYRALAALVEERGNTFGVATDPELEGPLELRVTASPAALLAFLEMEGQTKSGDAEPGAVPAAAPRGAVVAVRRGESGRTEPEGPRPECPGEHVLEPVADPRRRRVEVFRPPFSRERARRALRASVAAVLVQVCLQGVPDRVVAVPELGASVLVVVVDVFECGLDLVRHPSGSVFRELDVPREATVVEIRAETVEVEGLVPALEGDIPIFSQQVMRPVHIDRRSREIGVALPSVDLLCHCHGDLRGEELLLLFRLRRFGLTLEKSRDGPVAGRSLQGEQTVFRSLLVSLLLDLILSTGSTKMLALEQPLFHGWNSIPGTGERADAVEQGGRKNGPAV